jgi:GAF domain-containing protein
MSQKNRKYKRIEALFSESQPGAPDSPLLAVAKMPSAGSLVGDLTKRAEETRAQPSAEDTRHPSTILPIAVSSIGGRQDSLNDIDRGQKIGFTYDQGKVTSLKEAPLPQLENALSVPLLISGSTIGIIQAAGKEEDWTVQDVEIVSAVAAQLARQLKKLERTTGR